MVNSANRDRDRGRGGTTGGKRSGGFVYKERNPDEVKRRAEQTGGGYDSPYKPGIDVFRPKQGDNTIRILPPTWEDHEHYGFDVWVHSFIGADQGTFLCLEKMDKKPCPICDEARDARAAGETDEAKALAARKATVAWIIDRADEDQPKLYPMPQSIDKEISEQSRDKKKGKVLLIDHPNDGYDIHFKRQGVGLKTKYYGWQIDRDPSPACEKQKEQDRILDFIQENPIPELLVRHDPGYMEKAMSGTKPSRDEDLDDDKGKGRGRKGRDDDGDEEDRRGRSRSSRDDDGDEDDRRGRSRSRDDDEKGDKDEPRGRRSRDDDDDKGRDKDEPRGRRSRDEDEAEEPRGRSRGRDKDDDKDEPRGRSRGRDKDEEPEEEERPRGRRSRDDDEPEEKEERSRGRSRSRDDDEKEEKDEPRERSRGRDKDDDKDEPRERRGGRNREESSDEEDRPRRGKGRDKDEDGEADRPRRSGGRDRD